MYVCTTTMIHLKAWFRRILSYPRRLPNVLRYLVSLVLSVIEKKDQSSKGRKKKKKDSNQFARISYKKEKRKKRREIFRVNSNCGRNHHRRRQAKYRLCKKKKEFSPRLSSIPPILSLNAINRLILKAKTSLLRVFFFLTFSLSLIHSLTRSVKILRARKIIPDWDWSSFIIHRCSKRTKKEEKRVYSLYIRRIENFLITYR